MAGGSGPSGAKARGKTRRSKRNWTVRQDPLPTRSKRRRVAAVEEKLGARARGSGDGTKALHHCNYCKRDISGFLRIKCAQCPDFDLCLECFSVGAEVAPHKSNHPYRVMQNLSFPLLHPDWNADEEILLLEGLEIYGIGDWDAIAEHVGTKTRLDCSDHYMRAYMHSSCSPLPDLSHLDGKMKSDLLGVAKLNLEGKNSGPSGFLHGGDGLKMGTSTSPVSETEGRKAAGGQAQQGPTGGGEDGAQGSVYNFKRDEFEPEYDTEAEQLLVNLDFKETDTEIETELKLRLLDIYNARLDERERRKKFILCRGLLNGKRPDGKRSEEEEELYERARVFVALHSQEGHENLLQGLIEQRKLRQQIEELQELRMAGEKMFEFEAKWLESVPRPAGKVV